MNLADRSGIWFRARAAETLEEIVLCMGLAGFDVAASCDISDLSAPERLAVKRTLMRSLRAWASGEDGCAEVSFGGVS